MDRLTDGAQENRGPSAGKRVTEGRCLFNLLFSSLCTLWFGAYAFTCIAHGAKVQALMFLFFALVQIAAIPRTWRQYKFIRGGGTLYIQPDSLSLPTPVSVVFVCILTVCISLATIVSVIALFSSHIHVPLVAWLITVLVNVLLWLYVAYCWYRINQDQRKKRSQVNLTEVRDDVWPPPPQQDVSATVEAS